MSSNAEWITLLRDDIHRQFSDTQEQIRRTGEEWDRRNTELKLQQDRQQRSVDLCFSRLEKRVNRIVEGKYRPQREGL